MSRLIIVPPAPIETLLATRGGDPAALLTPDPKEVWLDTVSGGETKLRVTLPQAQLIDTVFVGHLRPVHAGTSWSITAGMVTYDAMVLQPTASALVPDVAGRTSSYGHALWHGPAVMIRYLEITVSRPEAVPAIDAGVLVVGKAFVAERGQEWGSGRRPIDTGSATPLPSGGFSLVQGARKRQFQWTFGDLSQEETDQLDLLALDRGETQPVVVVEDTDRTPGLRSRIHYGLFTRWTAYERRNRRQTRWELGIEEWV